MDLVQLIMHEDTIAALKKLAAARHVSYHVLVKSWIDERLAQEQKASS